MSSCSICGRKTIIGRNRSHAQNRTSRQFKPNIQKVTVKLGDESVSGKICARCIKRLRKGYRDQKKPPSTEAKGEKEKI